MESEKVLKKKKGGCPNCGSGLVYMPEKKGLYCDACNTVVPLEFEYSVQKKESTGTESTNDNDAYNQWKNENKSVRCSSCGSNIVLSKLEVASSCPYCGSAFVVETSELPNEVPDGIIPFLYSKEQSIEIYKKGIKKKAFAPTKFKKQIPIERIKGIYIPSFGFDSDSSSDYSGTLAKDETHTDSNGRTYTTTRYFHISGHKDCQHRDVLVESSSFIDQKNFEGLKPYNLSKCVKYNSNFILGYSVEYFDNAVVECKKIANEIFKEEIKRRILSQYDYDRVVKLNINTNFSNQKYGYYLLPLYKNEYEYKSKKYTNYMNGQTGKVYGKYPISGLKITSLVLSIIAVIAIIVCLILFL